MDYSDALRRVKDGCLLQRSFWPEDKFIFFVPGSTFSASRQPLTDIFGEGVQLAYHGHIDINTGHKVIAPYTPSQEDMLATDWMEKNNSNSGKTDEL